MRRWRDGAIRILDESLWDAEWRCPQPYTVGILPAQLGQARYLSHRIVKTPLLPHLLTVLI
jgi:hypothetical protein